ncbi:hypothetical protein KY284_001605 [Solanum tuberosum]|nr:hypothetical protein KY284_001605 [Solanum tuberosum]
MENFIEPLMDLGPTYGAKKLALAFRMPARSTQIVLIRWGWFCPFPQEIALIDRDLVFFQE